MGPHPSHARAPPLPHPHLHRILASLLLHRLLPPLRRRLLPRPPLRRLLLPPPRAAATSSSCPHRAAGGGVSSNGSLLRFHLSDLKPNPSSSPVPLLPPASGGVAELRSTLAPPPPPPPPLFRSAAVSSSSSPPRAATASSSSPHPSAPPPPPHPPIAGASGAEPGSASARRPPAAVGRATAHRVRRLRPRPPHRPCRGGWRRHRRPPRAPPPPGGGYPVATGLEGVRGRRARARAPARRRPCRRNFPLLIRIDKLQSTFHRWEQTASNTGEYVHLTKELLTNCESIEWQVDELEKTISVASRDPAYYGLDEVELSRRRNWTGSARNQVGAVRSGVEKGKRNSAIAAHQDN